MIASNNENSVISECKVIPVKKLRRYSTNGASEDNLKKFYSQLPVTCRDITIFFNCVPFLAMWGYKFHPVFLPNTWYQWSHVRRRWTNWKQLQLHSSAQRLAEQHPGNRLCRIKFQKFCSEIILLCWFFLQCTLCFFRTSILSLFNFFLHISVKITWRKEKCGSRSECWVHHGWCKSRPGNCPNLSTTVGPWSQVFTTNHNRYYALPSPASLQWWHNSYKGEILIWQVYSDVLKACYPNPIKIISTCTFPYPITSLSKLSIIDITCKNMNFTAIDLGITVEFSCIPGWGFVARSQCGSVQSYSRRRDMCSNRRHRHHHPV